MKHAFFVISALMIPMSPAVAQSSTVTGAAGGAATGAILGGPVGAAVGGVAGAAAGTILAPPPADVRTYVTREHIPSTSVDGDIVVGETLPDTVMVRKVPKYETYGYAVVNKQRVIVDPQTHRVIEIMR